VKILLVGRNGQVGSELERSLPTLGELIATDRATLDLSDGDAIRRLVREVKPAVIINAAAYNAVDKAESEPAAAMRVNAMAPGILAEEVKRVGGLLVHYSTDYVFSGEKTAPYTEDDAPGPLSHYGRSKLEGERAIAASACRHLTLRTSWVYSERAANFYRIVRQKAATGEPMRMVDDQTSVPTPSVFLAEYTLGLLHANAEGLFHLVPSGQATRYGFAREVLRALGSTSKLEEARTSEFPSPARRPVYSVLDNRAAAAVLGRTIPDLKVFLRQFENSKG
jgi:dTDP-4-dehydrorhamnose reductase